MGPEASDISAFVLTASKFSVKLLEMFRRLLTPKKRSFFLFGPRGCGKSTWIREHFPDAQIYDLLSTREALRLSRDPGLLYDELSRLPKDAWVVIDEVQKVPALLDEVHRLIEDRRLRFVLSGSSARKLCRGGVNLLAGRAQTVHMFPLVSAELKDAFHIERAIRYGSLPLAVQENDPSAFLNAYVDTYLDQEIKAEAIVKDIGSFSRFLEIAARQNAQVTNVSNIARDAMVARQTVQGYFEILTDTLIGFWLPAWELKRSTKNVSHPKFYFFDPGVVRALSGRASFPPLPEESGGLLETLIVSEVRAYLSYHDLSYPISFWSNYDRTEVDLLCEMPQGFVAVEIKPSSQWRSQYNRGLRRVAEDLKKCRVTCLGVYQGERALQNDGVLIFPVREFLEKLWGGEIL